MIEISHLTKNYESAKPLKDINVVINDGDIVSIIGPSGVGKSTLLRCINMLESPSSGKIIVDGVDITNPRNHNNHIRLKMGMVFQSFNLFPNMTVIENVMKPQIDILKRSNQEAYDIAMKNLRSVGMDVRVLKYPDSLSRGQKQRVAIARTLSMDPDIILFDEPTSALDPTMIEEVQTVIRDLSKLQKTMIIVTHEMNFAREICNRILYLDQGIVYEEGSPTDIFDNPKKERTRRFVMRAKVFEYLINSKSFDYSEFISKVNEYGYKNQINIKIIRKLQSCFEELCLEILLHLLDTPLLFSCEYNDSDKIMSVSVSYNGKQFNPLVSDNTISLSILKNLIINEKYTYEEDNNYHNCFTFKLNIKD